MIQTHYKGETKNLYIPLHDNLSERECYTILNTRMKALERFGLFKSDQWDIKIPSNRHGNWTPCAFINFSSEVPLKYCVMARHLLHQGNWLDTEDNFLRMSCFWAQTKESPEKHNTIEGYRYQQWNAINLRQRRTSFSDQNVYDRLLKDRSCWRSESKNEEDRKVMITQESSIGPSKFERDPSPERMSPEAMNTIQLKPKTSIKYILPRGKLDSEYIPRDLPRNSENVEEDDLEANQASCSYHYPQRPGPSISSPNASPARKITFQTADSREQTVDPTKNRNKLQNMTEVWQISPSGLHYYENHSESEDLTEEMMSDDDFSSESHDWQPFSMTKSWSLPCMSSQSYLSPELAFNHSYHTPEHPIIRRERVS